LEDFFEMDRALSLREPGLIECEAFRMEFTGQTETLRRFLNGIGAGRLPVVVREVAVEQFRADSPTRQPIMAAESGAPVLLVKPGILKFGVILELVRLAANPVMAP
jgi:hypothetical protein